MTLVRDDDLKNWFIREVLPLEPMLMRFIKEKITIPFDLLVIDEAQDLSLLQWKVV